MPIRLARLTLSLTATGLCAAAVSSSAAVQTTTAFGPPNGFGYVLDGAIFPESNFATRPIQEIRVYWDVVVPPGYNAADIDASVILPVQFKASPWPIIPTISMDGDKEGWSGSGTFNYTQTISGPGLHFGPVWTFWTHQALGLPPDAADVLPSSRIEIDYINNLLGDADDDGDIDSVDLGVIFGNFTGPVGRDGQKTTLEGDADGDGDVDGVDLGYIFGVFTGSQAPVSVPEPAAIALLGLPLFVRRRTGCRRLSNLRITNR